MSLVFTYNCPRCGNLFLIYVPKSAVFGELYGQPGPWRMIDELEAEDGSLSQIQSIAAETGFQWVNTRLTEFAQCRICAERIDYLSFLRNAKATNTRVDATEVVNFNN